MTMSPERVQELTIAGFDWTLGLGPVLGPSREQRAVIMAWRQLLVSDPSLSERAAELVGPYRAEGPEGGSTMPGPKRKGGGVGDRPEYQYTGTQAGAVTYKSDTPEDGKKYLADWLKAKTFGKGGDVVLCNTGDAEVILKLSQSAIDDAKNWQGGAFSLPASALTIHATADAPEGCLAAVRKATHGPSKEPGVLFSDLIRHREDGTEEFITVRLADADAGPDKWAAPAPPAA